jgi:purine-nucleoside phosphorylase
VQAISVIGPEGFLCKPLKTLSLRKLAVMDEISKINEAVAFIRARHANPVEVGVILGSGLGGFVEHVEVITEISYIEIPHFPVSTVEGHSGKLILGTVGDKSVIVMAGRFHYYEGYSALEVVFPVRVMQALGAQFLFVSNAAGGVNPGFKVGDLMIIKDHISFSIVNPLLGKNIAELGPRFPDMSEPYSKALVRKAHSIASSLGHSVQEGVYYGVTGPTFETRAEYKMIHVMGADAVGMSTVQEVIAAIHCGMTVFAMSVITDLGIREEENIITHQEVLDAANIAAPKLTAIFKTMIETLDFASLN